VRQEHWLSEEQQFALINVITSVNKFNVVDSKLMQLFPGYSMDPYTKNPIMTRMILLNIKSTMIKLKNRRLELLYEVYLNYSEFLDVSGKLSESPLITTCLLS